jgi:hypothetical protein
VLKIIDIILKNRLITFENKETWNIIHFVNDIFFLHDVLLGSALAKRMALRSKALLSYLLKRSNIFTTLSLSLSLEDVNED